MDFSQAGEGEKEEGKSGCINAATIDNRALALSEERTLNV